MKRLKGVGKRHGFDVYTPIRDLSADTIHKILYGTGSEKYKIRISGQGKWSEGTEYETIYEGVIPFLERRHRETESDFVRRDLERFMRVRECQTCHGARLKPAVLAVTIHGFNIIDFVISM